MSGSSDAIWNRAAMQAGGLAPAAGDAALASLLRFHGLTMSGGMLDAVQHTTTAQIEATAAGYRFFDLDDIARLILDLFVAVDGSDLEDEDLERLAADAEQHYDDRLPTDDSILRAFEKRLEAEPSAFAPPDVSAP